jgi:hypothetical protein
VGGSLTDAQRSALDALAPLIAGDFYLGGGVAIALRLSHRQSRDLDFFATERDPTDFEERLAQLAGVIVTGKASGTLHLEVKGVPVSLLRYRYPMLHDPEPDARVPVRLASMDDLVCMKLSAIGGRGARRDFWDLHELLVKQGLSLAQALDLFTKKYPAVDRGHIVRALSYFGDADAEPMPVELTKPTWEEIKRDFARWVVSLDE